MLRDMFVTKDERDICSTVLTFRVVGQYQNGIFAQMDCMESDDWRTQVDALKLI